MKILFIMQFLLANPHCPNKDIGNEIVNRMKDIYSNYLYTIIVAETEELVCYYEKLVFSPESGFVAMAIMNYGT